MAHGICVTVDAVRRGVDLAVGGVHRARARSDFGAGFVVDCDFHEVEVSGDGGG